MPGHKMHRQSSIPNGKIRETKQKCEDNDGKWVKIAKCSTSMQQERKESCRKTKREMQEKRVVEKRSREKKELGHWRKIVKCKISRLILIATKSS